MRTHTHPTSDAFPKVLGYRKLVLLTIAIFLGFATTVTAGVTKKTTAGTDAHTSSVATLNSLTFNPTITRTTVSGPDFRDYVASVPYTVSSVTVTPVTTDAAATVTVNTVAVTSGTASAAIPLALGNNTITTVVTAQDGVTTLTYSIVITRQASNVATLSGFHFNPSHAGNNDVSNPVLVPGPDYKDYTATVANYFTSITLTPTASDAAATITVNGTAVTSGTASGALPLVVGDNTITIAVTAADGVTVKNYVITLTRLTEERLQLLSFSNEGNRVSGPDYRDYARTVTYVDSVEVVFFKPVDPASTVKINGVPASPGVHYPIALNKDTTTIRVVVTSSNGLNSKTYAELVTRLKPAVALLKALTFNPPVERANDPNHISDFNSFASVPNSVSSITVTPVAIDSLASIKVNGVPVATGTASAAIPLSVGENVITIISTAQDATTTATYNVTINRQVNAFLSALNFSPSITKTTVPGPDFRDYTATVPYTTTAVTVNPVTADATPTIKVNGVAVASGASSASIPLSVGANTITTIVTAADSITTNTYRIVITRQAAATLSRLTLKYVPSNSVVPLTQVTGSNFRDYTVTVPYLHNQFEIQHIKTHSAETVKVNGHLETSNSTFIGIPTGGVDTVRIEVTSADELTTNVYSIVITQLPKPPKTPDATLNRLTFSQTLAQVSGPDFRDYAGTVTGTVTSITFSFRLNDSDATVKVNGVNYPPVIENGVLKNSTATVPLSVGSNTISIVVKSYDSTLTNTYKTVITRSATGNDATYSSLNWSVRFSTFAKVSGPDFADWVGTVPYSVTSVKQVVFLTDSAATMTVNGTTVASGVNSAAIPLALGNDTIKTIITSANGLTHNTLRIIITREPLTPPTLSSLTLTPSLTLTTVTGPDYRDYTATADTLLTSIGVKAVLSDPSYQTLIINGVSAISNLTKNIALKPGINIITIAVSQDTMVSVYKITITKPHVETLSPADPQLSLTHGGLITLTKVSGADFRDYTASVQSDTTGVWIFAQALDTSATVKVNGTASGSHNTVVRFINLITGDNIITVTVTSADTLHTKTYKITVNRAEAPGLAPLNAGNAVAATPAGNDVIMVHENLSPNGDGLGDRLVIDGITNHPDNKLTIVNRGGALVYQIKGYDNTTRVFDGVSNITGKLQSAGTYFYSLDYKAEGKLKHKTGFIVIKY